MTTFLFINRISSLCRQLRKVGAAVGLLAAVALAGGAVAGSFFVPTKSLGVFVASVGCFVSGWLFAVFFAKALGLAKEEGVSAAALKEELAREQEAKAAAENRVAELESENAQFRKQRIEINAVRPILKLGLVEANMSVKDVDIRWMDDFDSEGYVESLYHASRSQYVGVLERSFKASYGVDLMKLRIRENTNCLRVAGIVPESLGFKDDVTTWLVRQKQTFLLKSAAETGYSTPGINSATGFKNGKRNYEIDRSKPFEGSLDLNETAPFCERQEARLRERLNNGVGEDFHNLNLYIRHMAEGFIRLLPAPVNKPVVFEPVPLAEIEGDASWIALEDYAKEFNKQLEMTTP